MKTQLDRARDGEITEGMKEAALFDDVSPEFIRDGIANGHIVIYGNTQRKSKVVGITQVSGLLRILLTLIWKWKRPK